MLREREGEGAVEKPVTGVEMKLRGCGGKGRGQQGLHGGRRSCRKIVFENAITKLNTSSANFKTKLNR